MSVESSETEQSPAVRHVAVIMDGNGRWALERGLPRIEGHKVGAKSVHTIVEASRKLGIRYLTLFSFSTENWKRSPSEVSGLMDLFRRYLDSELSKLLENNIRLRAIGDLDRLPRFVRSSLERDIEQTRNNTGLDLILAVSYGGREEILHAARKIADQVKHGELSPKSIDEELFQSCLWTNDIPDPDLLIRTSGEMRISNFLLWQLAYAELVVAPEYWPDFNAEVFQRCLAEYARRERRFGLTSEQIKSEKRNGRAETRCL